jgi:hypothetical protein
MAHYAKVLRGQVVQVIKADPEFFASFKDTSPGTWLQTSFNTKSNQHLTGGTALRGNFAGVGYTYDAVNDVFYPPKPVPEAVLNTSTWTWEYDITPYVTRAE